MHHLADDRPRTDNGYLYDHVVELLWMVPRQRRHLGAALHLEHPDSVRALQRAIDLRVFRQLRQINPFSVVLGISSRQSLMTAIMPNPRRSTLMMPRSAQSSLSHWTTVRPGIEARSKGTTRSMPLAYHHATGVLSEMSR